jgi:hypothetical protein
VRRSRIQSRENNRNSKALPKDLLSLVKASDFNNTLTISNQRVAPVSTKNKNLKLLMKQETPLKAAQETPNRRMSQIVSKL